MSTERVLLSSMPTGHPESTSCWMIGQSVSKHSTRVHCLQNGSSVCPRLNFLISKSKLIHGTPNAVAGGCETNMSSVHGLMPGTPDLRFVEAWRPGDISYRWEHPAPGPWEEGPGSSMRLPSRGLLRTHLLEPYVESGIFLHGRACTVRGQECGVASGKELRRARQRA